MKELVRVEAQWQLQETKKKSAGPTSSVKSGHHHQTIQIERGEFLVEEGNRSRNEGGREVSGDSDHGQSCVLEFLHGHIFLLCVRHLGPVARPVEAGLLVDLAREGLAFHLSAVLDSLNDGAEDDELGPPLVVSLEEGLDGVGGLDGSLEGPVLWEGPSDNGKHCRSSVGEFGLSEEIDGCPLCQFKRIEL